MVQENNTIRFLANHFRKSLENQFDSSEIEQLLQITFKHFLGLEKADILLDGDKELEDSSIQKVIEVLVELKKNKPLAQIIGEWEFFDLTFLVNEDTLIPRPETEELVQLIVNDNQYENQGSILDIGTGSGCIAISLKKQMENHRVTAFDISLGALRIASENAKRNEVSIDFRQVDILNPELTKGSFDIIVSNPPYITQKEKTLMHPNVIDYEPHLALFVDDQEPLLFYNAIANFAKKNLTKDGKLYFEINEYYGKEVKKMLQQKKFKNVNIVKDINEKDRIINCNI